jgi:hypothetical protein
MLIFEAAKISKMMDCSRREENTANYEDCTIENSHRGEREFAVKNGLDAKKGSQ